MLNFNHVSKTFNLPDENELVLFDNLSFAIAEHEFVVIIGTNGSGKTTLFNLLGGQEDPTAGEITFKTQQLNELAHHQRAKMIARVHQDPLLGTAPALTVFENLSLAFNKGHLFNFKRGKAHQAKQRFIELLKELDLKLEDKLDTPVGLLSGGQRQALALLMVLLQQPQLLLLDEHTAALDPKSSERIMALTKQLVTKHQLTTIMITHNLEQALNYGTRLMMFNQGKLILDVAGSEKQQLKKAELAKLYQQLQVNELIGIN